MDYTMTDEQKAIRKISPTSPESLRARRCSIARERTGAFAHQREHEEARLDRYLGMPEEKYGGTSNDLISQAIAGEEVARACASTFLSCGASYGLFGMPLKMFGNEEQKQSTCRE